MLNVFNIFNGDKRTALVKKNIALSFVIKAWSCVFQFLVVPLSLLSLTSYEYGLWLTINSILMGIDSIDVGFGNGLRNKLAEALAQEDMEKARQQVSSAFFMLIITILPVVLLLSIFIFNVDSYKLLNVSQGFVCNLDSILFVSLLVMGVTFIFKFIGNVYQGLQFPAVNNLLVVIGQTISLIGLFILSKLGNGNLFTVALIFTLSPLFTYLVAYPITFFKKYRHLAPSISYFRWQSFRELFSLGVIFFIIQVSGLLLFMSSNVIITKILTPEAVTPYQIAYRYFTALYMVFIIITTPLWNATTDAYTRGDWKWISNVVQKLNYIKFGCIGIVVLMFLFSQTFYNFWVGDSVHVDKTLSILMGVYTVTVIFSSSYSTILFGIGKIRLMAVASVIEVCVFVPLEFLGCKLWGVAGLISVIIVATATTAVVNYIQFNKIKNNTAKGIWNK